MKEYLLSNAKQIGLGLLLVLVVVGIAVLIWKLCKAGYRKKVFSVLYELVCRAEEEITGTKRGQERKAAVLAAIHARLPGWAQLLVTEQDLDNLLEKAVTLMKQKLAEGAENAV